MNLNDFQFEDSIPGGDALRRQTDGNPNAWDIYTPRMRNTHLKDLIWDRLVRQGETFSFDSASFSLSKRDGFNVSIICGPHMPSKELQQMVTNLVIDAIDHIPNWCEYVPKITVGFGRTHDGTYSYYKNGTTITLDSGLWQHLL